MIQTKYRLIYFILMLVGTIFTVRAVGPKSVSVYVDGDISKNQKQIVSSAVVTRLTGNKEYVPFERNEAFLKALMAEHDYQVSGEVSDSQIRKIGNRYGVDHVITIIVTLDEESVFLNARLIDLESGKILKAVNIDRPYKGNTSIKNAANNAAYRLLNKQSK